MAAEYFLDNAHVKEIVKEALTKQEKVNKAEAKLRKNQ